MAKAMRECILETGSAKLLNVTVGGPSELCARGKFILSQFGWLEEDSAALLGGYVAGGVAETVARRNSPIRLCVIIGRALVQPPVFRLRGDTRFLCTPKYPGSLGLAAFTPATPLSLCQSVHCMLKPVAPPVLP